MTLPTPIKGFGPFDLGPDFSGGPEGPDRSLLAHCLTLVDPANGWALEFGTGSGETTRMIAEVSPVITFDSFKGLPEDWRPGFPKGWFGEFTMPTDIPGATVVPGWFADTLPGYDWPEEVCLVHFDADLYSSTKTALDAMGHLIVPGVIVIFDEYHGFNDDITSDYVIPGEARAWMEFATASKVKWTVIGHGREQWAIRITAIR